MNPLNTNHLVLFCEIDIENASSTLEPSLILALASAKICVLASIDMIITVNIPMKNVNPNGNHRIGNIANIANISSNAIPETEMNPVQPRNIRMNNPAIINPSNVP
jgi:hypothetical protein